MAQKDMRSARERRLRRSALRKGLSVRRVRRGQERGRYRIIEPQFEAPINSLNRVHPHSFSLEEAEAYLSS
jgi:hypothetical protein